MKKIKTLAEFIEKIYNNEIKIYDFGHNTISGINSKGHLIECLKEMTEENFQFIKKAKKVFRRFDSSYGYIVPLHITFYCYDCGENLKIMPIDENSIALLSEQKFWEYGKETGRKDYFDYSIPKKEFLSDKCQEFFQCGLAGKDVTKERYINEIDVHSGDLFFKNYFKNDEIYEFPKEIRYNRENSINHLLGRFNLMQYLAKKNVGYGQMGNMDVSIFLKETKDQIIITSPYIINNYKETQIKGFKMIGRIDCSVWRWMCADKETLKKFEESTDNAIEVNVTPGRWVIEHYYGLPQSKQKTYSKLYLKK